MSNSAKPLPAEMVQAIDALNSAKSGSERNAAYQWLDDLRLEGRMQAGHHTDDGRKAVERLQARRLQVSIAAGCA